MSDLGQTSSLIVRSPASHLLLLHDLVLDLRLLVQLVEGVDYDGYGEGDDENTTDGTGGSTQLSEPSPGQTVLVLQITDVRRQRNLPRCDVPVAHRCHGDDGPVQCGRHRDELVRVGVFLHDEGEAGEDEHAHDHHQTQQAQLLVGVLQCGAKSL